MPMVMLEEECDGEEEIPDPSSATNPQQKNRMFSYGKEVCLILVLLFSYVALHNPMPNNSKSTPNAVRFFSSNSIVDDFYTGNLKDAFEKCMVSDMSFIMYYAPWDAESQKVRWHFEAVARYYQKEIYFAAINCWQPGSDCRQKLAKISNFPVLMLYPQRYLAVTYRGIREVSHMIKFLQTAIRPVTRITKNYDLLELMTKHDAVVVGFFNFLQEEDDNLYTEFYYSALNFLGRDQLQEISFAVVTDKSTAEYFEVDEIPSIRMYLWNETVKYDMEPLSWSPENISQWVMQNLHQVAVWVQPPGMKSLTLSSYVQDGPVMLLFTPRNPLYGRAYYYDLLKEVALEFFNCNNSAWINQLKTDIRTNRNEISSYHKNALKECAEWRRIRTQEDLESVSSVLSESPVPESLWTNSSLNCNCQLKYHPPPPENSYDYGYCGLFKTHGPDCSLGKKKELDVCFSDSEMSLTEGFSWRSYFGFQKTDSLPPVDVKLSKRIRLSRHNGITSMLIGGEDELWSSELERRAKTDRCRLLRHARLLSKPAFPKQEDVLEQDDYEDEALIPNVDGFACKVNRTLSFLAMDSLQLHQFAEGLGVDVLHRKDKTALFIINPEQESHYLLEGPFTKKSLVDFIKGYVGNTLQRWLRSTSAIPRPSQFALGPTQTLHLNRYTERSVTDCEDNAICIPELSSDTFEKEVLQSKLNVVVMYHTPYCVFCHSISHVFLTIAKTLMPVSTLKFARIDGDNNDLPWEFTVHRFPSILFFPAKQKWESRVFPDHMQITVPNVAQFILSNLTPEERILAFLVICEHGSTQRPLTYQDQLSAEKCITQVKLEVIQTTGNLLGKYRSLISRWDEELGKNASMQYRRNIQQLTTRLRFLRQTALTLSENALFDSTEDSARILSEILSEVQDAFSQCHAALTVLDSKENNLKDETSKPKIDVREIDLNIDKLSNSLKEKRSGAQNPDRVQNLSRKDEL